MMSPRGLGIGGYSLVGHAPLAKDRQSQVNVILEAGMDYLVVPWTTEESSTAESCGGADAVRMEEILMSSKNREESLERKITEVLGDVFRRYDTNNDCKLSAEEVDKLVGDYVKGCAG